jgi:hypothetical protein
MNKNNIKNTWLSIPAFLIFLLACGCLAISIMAIVRYFFGGLAMVLAMPIYWYYIIGPIMDEIWEWFNDKYF